MKSLHFPHPEKSRAKLVEVSSLRLDLIVHKIDWRRVAGLFGGVDGRSPCKYPDYAYLSIDRRIVLKS